MSFFFSFLSFSVFLQIERERGYIRLGIRRNSPKVYLSYFDGFLWRIFLLLRALLLAGVLGFSSVCHEPCPTTNFSLFLFSLTRRRCHFRFRVPANHLASTFFLPVSGDPSEVTEYQHLLVSTLTHILYFDGLLLLIHARGNSSNLISIFSVGHHVTTVKIFFSGISRWRPLQYLDITYIYIYIYMTIGNDVYF